MRPRRLDPQSPELAAVLELIRSAFAYMDGRIDPPSSMHRLTLADLARQAEQAEVWVLGQPVAACVVLTPREDCLYLGKLAVDPQWRRKGLSRRLVELAVVRAAALGLPAVELQVRVELIENQAAFRAMGFRQTAATAHPGFARPTSLTYRRPAEPAFEAAATPPGSGSLP